MRSHDRLTGRHASSIRRCLLSLQALLLVGLPTHVVVAEGLVNVNPEARIDHVYFSKFESSTFSCKQPAVNCTTVVGRMIDERWSAKPDSLFVKRDFEAPDVRESFYRSTMTAWSPQYKNRTCTETYALEESPSMNERKPCKRTSLCKNDDRTPEQPDTSQCDKIDIPVTQEKGSFTGRFINSSGTTIEDYTVRVNSRTLLTFNGPPLSYRVTLDVSATEVKLNKQSREFDYIPVPCASIKVNGKNANTSCKVQLIIPGGQRNPLNIQVIDVTPSVANAKYIQYEVSLQGPPEEK